MKRTLSDCNSLIVAHTNKNRPGEPPGENNQITLFSTHRIRNLRLGVLRPHTVRIGHGGCPHKLFYE